jgi:hypothetical protein
MTDNIEKARKIIKNNNIDNYTIPCKNLYPFQWNWDSAFSALGIYTYDKDRALLELDMLFKGQWKNGMIPQIIFHRDDPGYFPGPNIWDSKTDPKTSCITQPPVVASIVWKMVLLGLRNNEKLEEYFKKLFKYHQWFVNNRDPYKQGLISIYHPWESGRDNSPDWDNTLNNITVKPVFIDRKDDILIDEKMRPTNDDYNKYMQIVYKCKELDWDNLLIYDKGLFNVCDPGVQFIFVRACKDLYKLAIFLKKDEYLNTIENWIDRYSNGCDKLWNSEFNSYTTYDIKENKLCYGVSCASLLYAYADVGSIEQRKYMKEHSNRILRHCNYLFPSWDPSSSKFDKKKYWRGPIWCIINYLLLNGFNNIGDTYLANKIRESTIKLIDRNGFFEYYDPINGKGYGGNNFTWTAAIYLILKEETLNQ